MQRLASDVFRQSPHSDIVQSTRNQSGERNKPIRIVRCLFFIRYRRIRQRKSIGVESGSTGGRRSVSKTDRIGRLLIIDDDQFGLN